MDFTCSQCNNQFTRTKREAHGITHLGHKPFCSRKCSSEFRRIRKTYKCTICENTFERRQSEIRSNNLFCSQSCRTKHQNTNKTHGTRISKLEKWIQSKLIETYPELQFIFNSSKEVGLELDIYIPELKLAFELNGIFHYEPIFGEDKLNRTIFNDNQKYQACISKNISLCVIDTSGQKYFKESTSNKYLDIIKQVVSESNGY